MGQQNACGRSHKYRESEFRCTVWWYNAPLEKGMEGGLRGTKNSIKLSYNRTKAKCIHFTEIYSRM